MKTLLQTRWRSLLGFVALTAVVGLIGNLATMREVPTWYAGLAKAPWNPPDWVFGPMWTMLYLIIAFCGWLLWVQIPGTLKQKSRQPALIYYAYQLILNCAWSIYFFGRHKTHSALVDITVLDLFVVMTMHAAWRIDRRVTYLFIPYLLWLLYATSLNAAIVYLN